MIVFESVQMSTLIQGGVG